MDPRIGHQVGLELGQVDVQSAVESVIFKSNVLNVNGKEVIIESR